MRGSSLPPAQCCGLPDAFHAAKECIPGGLHMVCPDTMCRHAPVSISNGMTIKFARDDCQHVEIDLVRLKPDPTSASTGPAEARPHCGTSEGPASAGPSGSVLATVKNTAAR